MPACDLVAERSALTLIQGTHERLVPLVDAPTRLREKDRTYRGIFLGERLGP